MRRVWLLILLLPAAGAEPGIQNPEQAVDATLFLHLDGPQDIALSPLAPPDSYTDDHAPSAIGSSVCATTPAQGFTGTMHHTFYAFVSPVPVGYADQVLLPAHRGIMGDLRLPPQDLRLHLFVTQTEAPFSPQVVLRATLREGDDISVGHTAMEAGRIIAQAQTEPADLSPALDGHPQVRREGDGVYAFDLAIPLPMGALVPARESFNLRMDLWMDNPHCAGESYLMPDTLAIHTSPAHRPRLDLLAQDVVRIERLAAVLRGDALEFQGTVTPVFGSADAIVGSGALAIDGPVAPQALSNLTWNGLVGERTFPPPSVGDGRLHFAQTWDFGQDAGQGAYTLRLQVPTETGALATGEVPFELGRTVRTCSVLPTGAPTCALHGEAGKASPAGPAALAMGLLALAAALRRAP